MHGSIFVTMKRNYALRFKGRMKKTVFAKNVGISADTLAKLSHNDMVSMDVIVRISRNLNCTVDDIVDILLETVER